MLGCESLTHNASVLQIGDAGVVEMLIGLGATADEAMPDGYTPVALAARVSAL